MLDRFPLSDEAPPSHPHANYTNQLRHWATRTIVDCVPDMIFCLNLHDQHFCSFHLCLCVGRRAEAGGYFSAKEAGLIFRFHCRPLLVPQAAVKVVLAVGWQFRATLGSDWSVRRGKGTVTRQVVPLATWEGE